MRSFEEKYVELSCLGQGGFGSVYAGLRIEDNLPVAVKHVPIDKVINTPVTLGGKLGQLPLEVVLLLIVGQGGADMAEKARGEEVRGEARFGGGGDGQAAVELLDWYELDQELIIVMERPVPAVELFDYIQERGGYLPEDQAKIILRQLVEAMVNFHSWGVLHRDIKPENLLVETGSAVPRIRVLDFGCGCIIQEAPYTEFLGTKMYIPPEWYLHGSYQAVPSAVWQLGVLLYNMLSGIFPFRTPDHILYCDPIPTMDGFSRQCKNLLKLCLAKCPEDRPTLEEVLLHPWLHPEEERKAGRQKKRKDRRDAESSRGGERKRVLEERQDSGESSTALSLEDASSSSSLSLSQGNTKRCRVDPRSPEVSPKNTIATTMTPHGTHGRVGCSLDKDPEAKQGYMERETELDRARAVSTIPEMSDTALLPRVPLPVLPRDPLPVLPRGLMPVLPSGLVPVLPRGLVPVLPRGLVPVLPRGLVPVLPRGPLPVLPRGLVPVLPSNEPSAPPEPPAESWSTPAPPELPAHKKPSLGHHHRPPEHLCTSRRPPGLPPELPRLFTLPPGRPPELPWPSSLPPGRPPDLPTIPFSPPPS
ncbi:serine/threonine-protein kinase prk-2-like [Osmerus eperlanus]|uniref:serine/threonine-protein kinase prk-2-like n=1 Tax=Osmerus eperlanus TaxID=29151 RepID=UPI002E137744